MNRTGRILAVTAGLIVGGAMFGALAAVIALWIALTVSEGYQPIPGDILAFAAIVGALFGGVMLPVGGWVVLRRVPLWLTFVGTLLGTVVGGILGWLANARGDVMSHGTTGAVLGFAAATLLLRLTVGRAPRVEGRRVSVS